MIEGCRESAGSTRRGAEQPNCIDGFWLCFWLAVLLVSLMTRALPVPFTPKPFGVAKAVLRKCGVAVS